MATKKTITRTKPKKAIEEKKVKYRYNIKRVSLNRLEGEIGQMADWGWRLAGGPAAVSSVDANNPMMVLVFEKEAPDV